MRAWGAGGRETPRRSRSRGACDDASSQIQAKRSSPGAERRRHGGRPHDGSRKRSRSPRRGRAREQNRSRSRSRDCSLPQRGNSRQRMRPRRRGRSETSRRKRSSGGGKDRGEERRTRKTKASESDGGKECNQDVASEDKGDRAHDSSPPRLPAEAGEKAVETGTREMEPKMPKGARPKRRAQPPASDPVCAPEKTSAPLEPPAREQVEDKQFEETDRQQGVDSDRRGRPKTKPRRAGNSVTEDALRCVDERETTRGAADDVAENQMPLTSSDAVAKTPSISAGPFLNHARPKQRARPPATFQKEDGEEASKLEVEERTAVQIESKDEEPESEEKPEEAEVASPVAPLTSSRSRDRRQTGRHHDDEVEGEKEVRRKRRRKRSTLQEEEEEAVAEDVDEVVEPDEQLAADDLKKAMEEALKEPAADDSAEEENPVAEGDVLSTATIDKVDDSGEEPAANDRATAEVPSDEDSPALVPTDGESPALVPTDGESPALEEHEAKQSKADADSPAPDEPAEEQSKADEESPVADERAEKQSKADEDSPMQDAREEKQSKVDEDSPVPDAQEEKQTKEPVVEERRRKRRYRKSRRPPKVKVSSSSEAPAAEANGEAKEASEDEMKEAPVISRDDSLPSESPAGADARKEASKGQVDDTDMYLPLIRRVYERRNPEKLSQLDDLVNKYEGRLKEVYQHVCEKYGEEPEDRTEGGARKSPVAETSKRSPSPAPKRGSGRGRKRQPTPQKSASSAQSIASVSQAPASAEESSQDTEGGAGLRKRNKKVGKGKKPVRRVKDRRKNAGRKVAPRTDSASRSCSCSSNSSSQEAEKRGRKERRRMAKLAAKQARRMQSQMMGVLPPFPGLMPGMPMSLNMMASMPPGFLAPHMAHMEALKKKAKEEEEMAESSQAPVAAPPNVEELRELIRGVYERRNPSKLGELDALFSKYAGSELDVYKHVCQKYGETPATISRSQEKSATAEAPVPMEATEATTSVSSAVAKASFELPAKMAPKVAARRMETVAKRRQPAPKSMVMEEEEEYRGGWPFRGEPYTDNEDSDGPVPPEWLVEARRSRPAKRAAPRLRAPAAKLAAAFDSDSNSSSSSSSSRANADKKKNEAGSSSEDSSSSEAPIKPPAALVSEASGAKAGITGTSAPSKATAQTSKTTHKTAERETEVAQRFQVGAAVLYWSDTHRQWTNAVVTRQNLDTKGALVSYDLDVKRGAQATRITLPSKLPPPPPKGASSSLAQRAAANTEAVKVAAAEPEETPVAEVKAINSEPIEAPEAEDLQNMYSQLFQSSNAAQEETAAVVEDSELQDTFSKLFDSVAPNTANEDGQTQAVCENSSTGDRPPEQEEVKVVCDTSPAGDEPPEQEEVKVVCDNSPNGDPPPEQAEVKAVKVAAAEPEETPVAEVACDPVAIDDQRPPDEVACDPVAIDDQRPPDEVDCDNSPIVDQQLEQEDVKANRDSSTIGDPQPPDEVVCDQSPTVDQRPLEEEVEMLEDEIDELLPGASVAAQDDDGSTTEDSNV